MNTQVELLQANTVICGTTPQPVSAASNIEGTVVCARTRKADPNEYLVRGAWFFQAPLVFILVILVLCDKIKINYKKILIN
jgi:hypothetical protein